MKIQITVKKLRKSLSDCGGAGDCSGGSGSCSHGGGKMAPTTEK